MTEKGNSVTREHIVPVRFSDSEIELVLRAADIKGINRSEYIREVVKASAKRVCAKNLNEAGL